MTLPPPDELVCLRCEVPPGAGAVAWNSAQGRLIHTTRADEPERNVPRFCGGPVVPVGMEWFHAPEPGDVALCFTSGGRTEPHHVRLGHPVEGAPGWWRGTPVCGKRTLLRYTWTPLLPVMAARVQPCQGCRSAYAKGGAP